MAQTRWEATPLGRPHGWPQSLRTAVAMCLESRFPTLVMWGESLVMIYNEPFRPILGDKHPEAMGQRGEVCWAEAWDQVGPMLSGVLQGEAVAFDNLLVPLERQGQAEDCYFSFSYSPIRDEGYRVAGVLVTVFETTERVLGDRRMRCLRELAEARADASSTAQVLDGAARVLDGFTSELPFACLYAVEPPGAGSPGTVPGSACSGLSQTIPASAWPLRVVQERRAPVTTTELPSAVARGAERDGAHVPSAACVMPVLEPTSAEVVAVAVFGLNPRRVFDASYRAFLGLIVEDLAAGLASATAREQERRRSEALAELDRAKTALLTNVSHEFRTPLTLMLGPIEDMIEQADRAGDASEQLRQVRRNGQRLLRLVNSLLDITRSETGQSAPARRTVDLGALTAQVAGSFSEVCERAGLHLTLDCPPVAALIDPEMWETIILNLLSNAFKFTRSGGISVVVEPRGETITVAVSDTGTGIAPEDLPRLTDRFYRGGGGAGGAGRTVEGSGIGLALVASLVELHGGTLAITSHPGSGTTVTIELPAHAAPVHPGPGGVISSAVGDRNPFVAEALGWLGDDPDDPAALPAEGDGADRPLILVADDNADMRRYLERVLGGRWEVVTVGDGEAALEMAHSHQPSLIVADVMMPTLDGFGLVRAIRSDPELTAIPVIILSARAGGEAADEGYAAGSDDYLVKPFRSQDLVNRVAARLDAVERARTEAERDTPASRWTAAFGELTGRLGVVSSVEELLAELLAAPEVTLDATIVALGLVDTDHAVARVRYGGDLSPEFLDRYHVLALDSPTPLVDVIRTGRATAIPDLQELGDRYRDVVRDAGPAARSALIEPLRRGDGEQVGALSLVWPVVRRFDEEHRARAAQVARLAAAALERIQVTEQEHRIAFALQERLLELEAGVGAVALSALYQPAGEVLRVGGDWYTATPLDQPGRVAVSVGDVVGHGLHGATVMSQLRSALAAAALTSTDPGHVLDLLERYAARLPGARCATVAYAVVDAGRDEIEYACAGHPYPLVVETSGETRFLTDGRRAPLAAYAGRNGTGRAAGRAGLAAGGLLLLYTDGLIERRGEAVDAGLARLAAAAARCARLPVGQICPNLLERMTPAGGYLDDVAMIALRPPGVTPESFVAVLPARVEELAPLRARLRAWLTDAQLPGGRHIVHDILLAVSEALNNAIEHGSEMDPSRTVTLEAFVSPSEVTATVSDTGRWRTDSSRSRRTASRGHGLTLIHQLSSDVKTVRSRLGTRVTMCFDTASRA